MRTTLLLVASMALTACFPPIASSDASDANLPPEQGITDTVPESAIDVLPTDETPTIDAVVDQAVEQDTNNIDATAEAALDASADRSAPDVLSDVQTADRTPPPTLFPFPEGTTGHTGTDDLLDAPQYLAFRKSPTELPDATQQDRCIAALPGLRGLPFYGNRGTCVIFNAGIINAIPDVTARRAVLTQGFLEVQRRVQPPAQPAGNRRIAVEVQIDVLQHSPDTNVTFLYDVLRAARTARVPVFIALDGINWLDWYFENVPGARDAANIEWTGYDATSAARIGWRNWGAQIRLTSPVPALTSRVYRSALQMVYSRLLPLLGGFRESLGADEQYLFGGVILGTEISVGVNYYHYPNGNALAMSDARCDPGLPYAVGCPRGSGSCASYNVQCPPSFGNGSLNGGVAQLGYRAALDLGALTAGQPMTRTVLDRIVSDYVSFLHRMALVNGGLPSHKIFSHTGGTFGGTMGVHTLGIARTGTAIPGWSMYFGDTSNLVTSLGSYLEQPMINALPWASPEWLPFGPTDTGSNWNAAYERSLGYRNNRMISVANWEGVSTNDTAMTGARTALTTPGNCAISPRVLLGTADLPSGTMLHFSRAASSTTSFLNVSSTNEISLGGTLANIDTVNEAVTSVRSYSLGNRTGTLYLQLVTDGCPSGTYAKRVLSPIVRLDTRGGSAVAPTPPLLFSASSGEHVTLSWEVPSGTTATYLNISSMPDFSVINAVNLDVSAAQLYVWPGFTAGTRFYARIVTDGSFGRRTSNTVQLLR